MPLGSESPGFGRRAIAAARSVVGNVATAPFEPGPPIPTPHLRAGEYSPANATMNAVLSFAAGARARANFRVNMARAQSQAAYQGAQMEHLQAETDHLRHPVDNQHLQDYTTPTGEVLKNLSPGEYSTAFARDHKPDEESVTYTMDGKPVTEGRGAARIHLAAKNLERLSKQETDRNSSSTALRALGMQEQQIDTEDASLKDDADARANSETEGLILKASSGNVGALQQLGLGGKDFAALPEGQKYATIRYAASTYGRGLQSQYRSEGARKNLARRSALGSQLTKYSGYALPPAGGDDIMQQLRDLAGPDEQP